MLLNLFYLNTVHSFYLKKQLQQLIHHFIPKFHSLKGFFLVNARKKYISKLQKRFKDKTKISKKKNKKTQD